MFNGQFKEQQLSQIIVKAASFLELGCFSLASNQYLAALLADE